MVFDGNLPQPFRHLVIWKFESDRVMRLLKLPDDDKINRTIGHFENTQHLPNDLKIVQSKVNHVNKGL